MIKIRLFCAGGFSTGILTKRMEDAAQKRNMEVDIKAAPSFAMERIFENESIDVALIGPQIAFSIEKIKKICTAKGVPVEVIPSLDYGRLNGESVLDLAIKLANINN